MKPNSLFNSIKRSGLSPDGFFDALEIYLLNPSLFSAGVQSTGIKPNGLMETYKRTGLFGEYKREKGESNNVDKSFGHFDTLGGRMMKKEILM